MSGAEAIATLALGAVDTAASISKQRAQRRQAQQRFALEQQQHAQEQQRRALTQRIEERRIERERKQALAAQRARLGAAGVGGAGGSADAIFAGVNQRADQQLADSRADAAIAAVPPLNLLEDDDSATIGALTGFGRQVISAAPALLKT
ncbi:MAG: hypothetical protein NXI21_17325 [Alphaproteobacteria bacterium]|nr:hypothetical protein [Alphaproteobacteria bacterium]